MIQLKLQQLEYYETLFKKKAQLEKLLEDIPAGWLVEHKRKNGYVEFYHHTYSDGVRKQKYLSITKDSEVIKKLREKSVY